MSTATVTRPPREEYAPFFEKYVSRVEEAVCPRSPGPAAGRGAGRPGGVRGEAERFRYAEGKWSIREVVGHVVDTERIMGYRACCVARGETASLPGFDENAYVQNASFDACPLPELLDELASRARGAPGDLPPSRRQGLGSRVGAANAHPISVRALAYVMLGHPRHHLAVLRERYLPHLPV